MVLEEGWGMKGKPGHQGKQPQIITGVLKVEDDHVN